MKKYSAILLFILYASSFAMGQTDKKYTATLKKMFEVSGTEESYKVVIGQMLSMFKEQYSNVDAQIWDELGQEFQKASLDELTTMLVPVYSKYLTQSDLEQVIAFYQSPAGKKFASKTPLIMGESMQVGQEWGLKIGQEFMKKLQQRGYSLN